MNDLNGVQSVQNNASKMILGAILKLRKKNLSYRIIGERLSMSKSEVYMMLKGQWFPKVEDVEQRILEKVRCLNE